MHVQFAGSTWLTFAATILGGASLFTVPPALAGDFQPARVAADARWLAFIDVEGILKSDLGKFFTEHGEELGFEFGEGDMEEIQAEFGIDPLKDLRTITVYGDGNPERQTRMVALLETSAAIDEAMAKFTGAAPTGNDNAHDAVNDEIEEGDISMIDLNGQKVHVLSDGAQTTYIHVRSGPTSTDRLVIISLDREWMTKGLSVLDGKSASIAGTDKPGVSFMPADGTLAFAVCNDLSWIDIDKDDDEPASAIINGAKGVEFAYGESGEDLFFNARLETASAEDAQNLSDIARGVVAMAKYAGSKDPEVNPLLEPMRSLELKTEGSGIVLRLKHNTRELIKALSAVAAAANVADDEDEDKDADGDKVEVKAEISVGSKKQKDADDGG